MGVGVLEWLCEEGRSLLAGDTFFEGEALSISREVDRGGVLESAESKEGEDAGRACCFCCVCLLLTSINAVNLSIQLRGWDILTGLNLDSIVDPGNGACLVCPLKGGGNSIRTLSDLGLSLLDISSAELARDPAEEAPFPAWRCFRES